MLRRLTERHKCHAMQLLTGTSDAFGTLYGLPHRDGMVSRPPPPSEYHCSLSVIYAFC